jgi:hypothetical protein
MAPTRDEIENLVMNLNEVFSDRKTDISAKVHDSERILVSDRISSLLYKVSKIEDSVFLREIELGELH